MKTVKFLLNVGTTDAARLRLDPNKLYQAGDIASFADDHAELLLKESFVIEVEEPKHTAKIERKTKAAISADE